MAIYYSLQLSNKALKNIQGVAKSDTSFFLSENKNVALTLMVYLNDLPIGCGIIQSLILGASLNQNDTRFEMVPYLHNSSVMSSIISSDQCPFDFICLEGVLNAVNKTITQNQEYHERYWHIGELQIFRDIFGQNIV